MKLFRATNTMVLDIIKPHLLAIDVSSELFLQNLEHALKHRPDMVYVIVAIENQECHGFAVVSAPDNVDYVFVEQAWSSPRGTEAKIAEQSIARIVTWAEYVGRQGVRFETRRDPEGLFQTIGFQAISTVK